MDMSLPFQTADRHRIKYLALNRGLGQRNRVSSKDSKGETLRVCVCVCIYIFCSYYFPEAFNFVLIEWE